MVKEIDWNCQRQAFKNKRNMLKAIAYGVTKIKNSTITEIKPTEVQDFLSMFLMKRNTLQ